MSKQTALAFRIAGEQKDLQHASQHGERLAAHKLALVVQAAGQSRDVLVHHSCITRLRTSIYRVMLNVISFGPYFATLLVLVHGVPHAEVAKDEHDVIADDSVRADLELARHDGEVLFRKVLVKQTHLAWTSKC